MATPSNLERLHHDLQKAQNALLANAVAEGNTKYARLALDSRADPNLVVDNNSMLDIAAKANDQDTVRLLIASKANVHQRAKNTFHTSLHTACLFANAEIVKLLLEENASHAAHTPDGPLGQPLQYAVSHADPTKSLACVEALVEANADVNAVNAKTGGSALSISAQKGHFMVVKYLLDAKANPAPMQGASVMMAAAPFPEIIHLLKEATSKQDENPAPARKRREKADPAPLSDQENEATDAAEHCLKRTRSIIFQVVDPLSHLTLQRENPLCNSDADTESL